MFYVETITVFTCLTGWSYCCPSYWTTTRYQTGDRQEWQGVKTGYTANNSIHHHSIQTAIIAPQMMHGQKTQIKELQGLLSFVGMNVECCVSCYHGIQKWKWWCMFVGVQRLFVTVTDISRPCQPEKLIPLLPWPGFDPSFSGHNDRRAITASGHDYAFDHSAIGAGGKWWCR